MNIDIYSKYKVKFLRDGAYISQEDSTPDDYVFSHYENIGEQILEGYKVLDIIKRKLDSQYIQEFSVKDNTIKIEIFNYNNGEGDTCIMTIDRINTEE